MVTFLLLLTLVATYLYVRRRTARRRFERREAARYLRTKAFQEYTRERGDGI